MAGISSRALGVSASRVLRLMGERERKRDTAHMSSRCLVRGPPHVYTQGHRTKGEGREGERGTARLSGLHFSWSHRGDCIQSHRNTCRGERESVRLHPNPEGTCGPSERLQERERGRERHCSCQSQILGRTPPVVHHLPMPQVRPASGSVGTSFCSSNSSGPSFPAERQSASDWTIPPGQLCSEKPPSILPSTTTAPVPSPPPVGSYPSVNLQYVYSGCAAQGSSGLATVCRRTGSRRWMHWDSSE